MASVETVSTSLNGNFKNVYGKKIKDLIPESDILYRNDRIKFVECWMKWDVLEIDQPQDFMVIIDIEQRKAIYYEYAAHICPDYERPYVSVSICAVRGKRSLGCTETSR